MLIVAGPSYEGEGRGAELDVYARVPLEIVEGDGVTVRSSDGRSFLDFYGGHAAALLGYRHPRLLEVLHSQAERLFFQTNLVASDVRAAAARRLAAIAPPGLERVFLCNSGAEANENALRLAFLATRRRAVVALEGGFHGRSAAAAACTSGAERWYGFPRTPFDVERVVPGDEAALERAIGEDTAAVILEPVMGIAGARALDPAYLRLARRLCDERGALLIADEVQCGMGRTGETFACLAADVSPDVLTAAKGIAGGFPAAAMLTTEELAGALRHGDLGSTFGGGPLAAALIAAVSGIVSEPSFLAAVRARSDSIRSRCVAGPVQAIRGRGLLLGLVCSRPAREVLAALRERGILAGGAADPRIVRLMPPLIIEESHVAALANALKEIEP